MSTDTAWGRSTGRGGACLDSEDPPLFDGPATGETRTEATLHEGRESHSSILDPETNEQNPGNKCGLQVSSWYQRAIPPGPVLGQGHGCGHREQLRPIGPHQPQAARPGGSPPHPPLPPHPGRPRPFDVHSLIGFQQDQSPSLLPGTELPQARWGWDMKSCLGAPALPPTPAAARGSARGPTILSVPGVAGTEQTRARGRKGPTDRHPCHPPSTTAHSQSSRRARRWALRHGAPALTRAGG